MEVKRFFLGENNSLKLVYNKEIYTGAEAIIELNKLSHQKVKDLICIDQEIDKWAIYTKNGSCYVLEEAAKIASKNLNLYNKLVKKSEKDNKKVTRKNKHSNSHIAKASVVVLTPIVAISGYVYYKTHSKDYAKSDDSFYVMQNENEEKSSDISYELPAYEEEQVEENKSPVVEEQVEDVFQYYPNINIYQEKAKQAVRNYGMIIKKYCDMCGVDRENVMAIAIQERGEHSEIVDKGGAIGLMQIQVGPHLNEVIKATDGSDMTITMELLKDLEGNIQAGIAIYKQYLDNFKGNKRMATEAYNKGCGSVNKMLKAYCEATGKEKDEVISSDDTGWLDYRGVVKIGDPNYLEHIARYVMDTDVLYNTQDNNSIIIRRQ